MDSFSFVKSSWDEFVYFLSWMYDFDTKCPSIYFEAIFGHSFCTGAKKAFMLLLENILRVAAINSVGTFVLFLGKLTTVAVVLIVGNELIRVRTIVKCNTYLNLARDKK